MADCEPTLLRIIKERGPISVRRLRDLTGFPKRCINGALHGSKKTAKVEHAPLSSRTTRPLWSYSETPIRPIKVIRRKEVVTDKDDQI